MTPLRAFMPLAVGLSLAMPLAVSAADAPKPAAKVAPADGVKRTRDRLRSRSEWRQLRRQTRDKAPEDPDKRGCNDSDEPESRERPKEQSGACAGLSQAFSGITFVLMGLAIALLVGLLIWGIAKLWGDKDDDDDEADFGPEVVDAAMPATPPGEKPASVYLKRALAMAEAGDYKGAIRQLLLGAMSWTERKNLIRFRKGLTNRDYLRALYRRQTQHRGMQAVVEEFEKVYFGRREASAERFRRVLPGYRDGFEGDDDARFQTGQTDAVQG